MSVLMNRKSTTCESFLKWETETRRVSFLGRQTMKPMHWKEREQRLHVSKRTIHKQWSEGKDILGKKPRSHSFRWPKMDELTRKRYREDFYREKEKRTNDDRDGRKKIERIRGDELPNRGHNKERKTTILYRAYTFSLWPLKEEKDGHLHNRAAKMSSRNGAGDDH